MDALLAKATTADENPAPGYVFTELSKLTHTDASTCDRMSDWLFKRLARSEPAVKWKALLVMKHVAKGGRLDFRRALQRQNEAVKACLSFKGPPDPLRGDEPYRRVRIRALASEQGGSDEQNIKLRSQVSRLLSMRQRLRGHDARNLQKFLRSIDDPDTFADLAAFNLCDSARFKQRILETLDVNKRLGLLKTWAKTEVETLRLTKTLQGELPDDHVSDN
jgi:ATP-dependent Lon protease